MKVQTYVIIMADRKEAERLEGSIYTSTQDIKDALANDGIDYNSIMDISDFMDDWNTCDDDDLSMVNVLETTFISYVYVVLT